MESAEHLTRRELAQEWGTTPRQQYKKLQEIRSRGKELLTKIQRVVAYELQISVPSAARQDPSDRFNAWLERNGREQPPQRDNLAG
jgi:hypothetical protein